MGRKLAEELQRYRLSLGLISVGFLALGILFIVMREQAVVRIMMIFGIVVWVFVIAGLILFIKDFKKMSLLPGEVTIEKGDVVSETWLNMGMMINLIISLSLMIYILLV